MSGARTSSSPTPSVLAIGAGLLVFAARAATLRFGASEAPFLDQWHVEADQILSPWLDGRLSWTAFFAPHHEHFPVWTRLLAWAEAALFRCWDPLVQGTVNAALFGVFAGVVAAWLSRNLAKPLALLGTLLLVVLYGLPHSWENSIWGLQSSEPLCLLFAFWHVRGSLLHPTGTLCWWLAQLSGVAALGTFGSAWAAPLAVALVLLWTEPRAWRRWLPPALLAAAGLALLFVALRIQPKEGALALHAPDFTRFLGSWVIQAGWPSPQAFAGAVVYFPAFLLLLALRGRTESRPFDLVLLALALFSLGQAGAFGVGRSAGYIGFVSRYADFLALGVLVNGLVLWRLFAARLAARWIVALLALVWLGTVGTGLNETNRTSHTRYFQENAGAWRWHRETALKQYLATRDPQHLATENARTFLYPEPTTVARLLAQPGFTDLLPANLRADPAPKSGDAAGVAVRMLGEHLEFFGWAGGFLLLLGITLPLGRTAVPEYPTRHDPWRAPLAATLALASGAAVLLWPTPFEFDAETRLIRLVTTGSPMPEFSFRIVTPSPYPPDNLVGGASLWPENFRNLYFGTHIDGPAFTGRAESSRFKLTSAFLVVPFAGYPSTPGNSLTFEILDDSNHVTETKRYTGANPDQAGFWGIDIRAHFGKSARLVIQDGQATGIESWIAVAPPLQVPRDNSAVLNAQWQAERTASAHVSLGLFSLAAFIVAGAALLSGRRASHG